MKYVSRPEQYKWVDKSVATSFDGKGAYVEILCDYYWVVNAQGQLCFYTGPNGAYEAPQANTNKKLATSFATDIPGAVGIKFVPVVFVHHDCSDYS